MAMQSELSTIAGLPLFERMPPETRERVASVFLGVSTAAEVADGETLLHQGDLGGDAGFLLIDGRVEVALPEAAPAIVPAPALLGEIHQFNPRAQRTATVRAAGAVKVRRFSWQDLYAAAQLSLTPNEQGLLMDALERSVCERIAPETLVDLPALRGLPDALKVRVSLSLHWIAQRVVLPDGACLFDQDGLCGDAGYLLLHGEVELRKAGRLFQTIAAPNFLSVLIEFDPDLKWTATASAHGAIEFLKFSWLNYRTMIKQRLSAQDLERFTKALAASATEFTH